MLLIKRAHATRRKNIVVRLTRRFFPITDRSMASTSSCAPAAARRTRRRAGRGGRADARPSIGRRSSGPARWMLTPLLLALLMVEFTDLIFAVDSIPAIFAITADPFLVFTSNVFAILGLRSLYFALAGMMDKFRYLKSSLARRAAAGRWQDARRELAQADARNEFQPVPAGGRAVHPAAGVVASIFADRRARRLVPQVSTRRIPMLCPRCDGSLTVTQRDGVEIDMCPKCRGVWLDRGELEKIIEPHDARSMITIATTMTTSGDLNTTTSDIESASRSGQSCLTKTDAYGPRMNTDKSTSIRVRSWITSLAVPSSPLPPPLPPATSAFANRDTP